MRRDAPRDIPADYDCHDIAAGRRGWPLNWHLKAILFSTHDDFELVRRAIQLRANDYLLKAALTQELAFDRVTAGRRYISAGLAQRVAFEAAFDKRFPPKLSQRENDVLKLLVAGESLAFISVRLGVGKSTLLIIIDALKAKFAVGTVGGLRAQLGRLDELEKQESSKSWGAGASRSARYVGFVHLPMALTA